MMGKRFWTIKAADDDSDVGEIYLYGYISESSWWGDEVTPKQFKKDLDALGDVSELKIYINSGGGDVFAAQAIYSMLRRHKATKRVFIDGLAASAASFIAMVGDTITMPKNAMLMIHNPAAYVWSILMASDARKIADDLDKIREPMIATYAAKSGLTDDEIIAYLDAETWFTADEAKDAGFVDEVEELKEVAASIDGDELTINGRKVDLARFRNFPKDKVAQTASVEQEPAEVEPEPVKAEKPEPQAEAPAPDKSQERLRLLRLRARL